MRVPAVFWTAALMGFLKGLQNWAEEEQLQRTTKKKKEHKRRKRAKSATMAQREGSPRGVVDPKTLN